MLNAVSGPNFRGGNLIINSKNGDSKIIKTDSITNIENVESTNLMKFKGVYIYTDGTGFANPPIYIRNIPYQTVVEAYQKAKNDNVDAEINI